MEGEEDVAVRSGSERSEFKPSMQNPVSDSSQVVAKAHMSCQDPTLERFAVLVPSIPFSFGAFMAAPQVRSCQVWTVSRVDQGRS